MTDSKALLTFELAMVRPYNQGVKLKLGWLSQSYLRNSYDRHSYLGALLQK